VSFNQALIIFADKPYNTTITNSTGLTNIRINASLTLICATTAFPPAHIFKFFRNGLALGETSTGMYNISKVTKTDNGTYSCVAENTIGKSLPGSVTLRFHGMSHNTCTFV